ncbi:F0F1 ATP synthase subunit B' [Oceanicella sp. SM1341]|uniref:F0F1 ATP synthase subunit B' n=1 Tax=Oceanicella sp. SM1341 TaxID=1548889 RepID=UPI000E552E53|nr:F0F1 ATP synthase subunit B' [Oceanicella sp. SM1341]
MATETAEELIHEAAEPHASGGLPQLDFSNWDSQIFWLVVALVLLYFLMSRIALPRISSVIEDRADAIADDLDQAADLKRRAEEAEVSYTAALNAARAEAQTIAAEARAEVQKELDAAIAKADAEIAARTAESEKRIAEIRDGALEAVETVATDTAQAIVAALLPAAQDEAAISAAVKQRVS